LLSLFSISDIDAIELSSTLNFKDAYGNSSDEVAFKFAMMRLLANKINWKSVELNGLGYVVENEGGGNGVYVHPALKSAWNVYLNQ
jgi:hypothetical protein